MNINISSTMSNAKAVLTEGAFQAVGSKLSQARQMIRYEIRKSTSPLMIGIINKLQSNSSLNDKEISLVRAWIVGDAESYLKMENDFENWLTEYERLQQELVSYEQKSCNTDELWQLHGLLEDAARTSYDIANFLEKQGRIKRLEKVLADGIDDEEREKLTKILISRLQSDDF
jgi:hypothetical protein